MVRQAHETFTEVQPSLYITTCTACTGTTVHASGHWMCESAANELTQSNQSGWIHV